MVFGRFWRVLYAPVFCLSYTTRRTLASKGLVSFIEAMYCEQQRLFKLSWFIQSAVFVWESRAIILEPNETGK